MRSVAPISPFVFKLNVANLVAYKPNLEDTFLGKLPTLLGSPGGQRGVDAAKGFASVSWV
jgi:hypothetical protein